MKQYRRPLWGVIILLLLLLSAALPAVAAPTSRAGESVVLRVPRSAASQLAALGLQPTLDLDYGSFRWLEVSQGDFARLQAAGVAHSVEADPFTLTLGEQRFDPLRAAPALPAGWDRVQGAGPDLYLVQLSGPTRAAWLDSLRASGLAVVQYIHPHSYVVWGEATSVSRAAAQSFVRWSGPFAPAYRVLPQWRALSDSPIAVQVLLYRGADTAAALRGIERLGGTLSGQSVLNPTWMVAGFTLSGAQLQAAAQLAGVYSIQPVATDGGLRGEMSNQVNVNNVDANNAAFPGYLDWLDSVGLSGEGVIIANVDGGVQQNHPDLVNRVIGCVGSSCGNNASSDHGTHTAGIMAGDASSGVVDSRGFLRGLGMAPGANLVEQLYSPTYTQPGGMLRLMTQSYNNGASLSGNSWGPSGSPQGYDNNTMQVDIGTRDADPDAEGNQPLSFVLSFMNGNGGVSSQGTPDEAKNIFTIGSTKMQANNGAQILEINDLSSNSAHGPALDGRTIPHMVAPGCSVDSTVANGYGLLCGTSMASPHVSGAVALFIEYYRGLFGVDPSPALVKAAFLPVAHDLAGHDDADGNTLGHPFDSKQGWGRMDTEAVVDPQVEVLYFDQGALLDDTGEEWVQTLSAADPSQPLRLMLVWTDAPGHGLGGSTPAWNNDLDLIVEVDGQSYLGNHFGADGWSTTGGSADGMNNTEGVFLAPATRAIPITVRVVASDLPSDGVPTVGDSTDQDFALVCVNCATDVVELPVMEISKAQPEGILQPGETITYTISVTNTSANVPATGVVVSDTLNGTTVVVPGPSSVEPGTTETFLFAYEVQQSDCGTTLVNTASVSTAEGVDATTPMAIRTDVQCDPPTAVTLGSLGTPSERDWRLASGLLLGLALGVLAISRRQRAR